LSLGHLAPRLSAGSRQCGRPRCVRGDLRADREAGPGSMASGLARGIGLEKALRATARSKSSLRETRPPQRLVRYLSLNAPPGTSASDFRVQKTVLMELSSSRKMAPLPPRAGSPLLCRSKQRARCRSTFPQVTNGEPPDRERILRPSSRGGMECSPTRRPAEPLRTPAAPTRPERPIAPEAGQRLAHRTRGVIASISPAAEAGGTGGTRAGALYP
jgi:hypothetical protein